MCAWTWEAPQSSGSYYHQSPTARAGPACGLRDTSWRSPPRPGDGCRSHPALSPRRVPHRIPARPATGSGAASLPLAPPRAGSPGRFRAAGIQALRGRPRPRPLLAGTHYCGGPASAHLEGGRALSPHLTGKDQALGPPVTQPESSRAGIWNRDCLPSRPASIQRGPHCHSPGRL